MKTLTNVVERSRAHSLDLRSPLAQSGMVWATLSPSELNAAQDVFGLRRVDPGGVFAITEKMLGPVERWAILGDNVIGATGWADVSLQEQYEAVTTGAAAFIASAMLYVRVSGSKASAVLDSLSPRTVSGLPVDSARFCLFTTPVGTVDEEAVVIRTGPEDYVMSCGGGKYPAWLRPQAIEFGDVLVEEADVRSFNIKGPKRLAATVSLLAERDADAVARLKPFQSCLVSTSLGTRARVLRTVVGYELWADKEVLCGLWRQVLRSRHVVTPAGWDLLNTYRMECREMVFGLYPLDLHAGTRLAEIGFEWMYRDGPTRDYMGRAALTTSSDSARFRLLGLQSSAGTHDVPLIGQEVFTSDHGFVGYVTSAARSPRHGGPLAFAHLTPACSPGDPVVLNGQAWTVQSLPFRSD
jgi:aminomethyltransferase